MDWFKEFMIKYSIWYPFENLKQRSFNHRISTYIDNNNLLSNEFTIFKKSNRDPHNKQKFEQNNYTDKLLRDDIKMKKDYTVVNKELLNYIINNMGYECSDVICR